MSARYVQIDARPRAGAPARELRELGTSRDWRTVAHVEDDPDAIAQQLKEIRGLTPSQLYETRIGRRTMNPPPHLHIPETVAQLGTVLDLTTVCGPRRTLWEASDVGGLLMCADASAMKQRAGAAALYLLRVPERTDNAPKRSRAAYRAALIEALRMRPETKEDRSSASTDQLLAWLRGDDPKKAHALQKEWPEYAPDVHEPSATRHKNKSAQEDAAQTYAEWHDRDPVQITDADNLPNMIGVFIGHALRIGYRSDKWHARGEFEDYDHDYTEPQYKAPEVWADRADLAHAHAIVIVGGNQRITPEGID